MAIIKISELPAADTPLSASDVVPALQNGVTKKAAINQFGFIANGAGATTRTIQSKLRDVISVKDFGAVGDGVTDDTAAITAAANSITNGQTLYFPNGTYLVSYLGAGYTSVYGNRIMDFLNKSDISIIGDSATIKIVNHNITTKGGLMFMWFQSCKRVNISGFYFDMTFTGVNTSANFYPFVGAIITSDEAGAFSTLCSDFLVENCTFKLFHPYGQYANSGAPYLGDPNNGYKMFSVFFSGVASATTYSTQPRNATVRDLTFLDGHNGYGVWFWAWNDCLVDGVTAHSWVGKFSNANGTFAGGGVPCIRYIQFYCEGIQVVNSYFRAKPCNERTVAGFEGDATLVGLSQNLTGDYTNGYSLVENNVFILGNGDLAKSQSDYGVYFDCYGDLIVQGNTFDGITTSTNAYAGECVRYNAAVSGGNGHGTFVCSNNIFGSYNSYNNNIVFSNGAASNALRRCKSFICTGNISASQLQYFLNIVDPAGGGAAGCRMTIISNNTIDGSLNTVFDKNSSNSRAINYNATDANDQFFLLNNQIRAKNIGILANAALVNSPFVAGNNFYDVANITFGASAPQNSYLDKIFVDSSGNLSAPKLIPTGNVTAGTGMYLPAANTLALGTNGTERVRLDSAGNMGLGGTPSAGWASGSNAFQFKTTGALISNAANATYLSHNTVQGAVNSTYAVSSQEASYLGQINGSFRFNVAGSGTAGDTISFTEAMRITNVGRVGIGTPTPISELHVAGTGGPSITVQDNDGTNQLGAFGHNGGLTTYVSRNNASNGAHVWYGDNGTAVTERAQIDPNGNVVVNTAAVATNATDGFLYIPTCAGAPVGTPTTFTGRSPLVVDSTNNRFYVYVSGTWKYAALT